MTGNIAARTHMRSMTAEERGQRSELGAQMLDLLQQLSPEIDEVNPDIIAFAEIHAIRNWISAAADALRRRSAAAPVLGQKRKAE